MPWSRRRRAAILAIVAVLLVGVDLLRPPRRQLTSRAFLAAIHLYQATLSPLMPALGVRCRFVPTCSRYAAGAIAKRGALVGAVRAAGRIVRCGPWTPAGTVDPP